MSTNNKDSKDLLRLKYIIDDLDENICNYSVKEINDSISNIITKDFFYPAIVKQINEKRIFRAVSHKRSEKISCLSKLSYYSKSPLGRFHLYGNAIFYGCLDENTTFNEIRWFEKTTDDLIYVGEWENKQDLCMIFACPQEEVENVVGKDYLEKQLKINKEIINKVGYEKFQLIDKFLQKYFTKQVKEDEKYYYNLTVSAYKLFVEKNKINHEQKRLPVDGIFYLSTQNNDYKGICFAINRKKIHSHLKLINVKVYDNNKKFLCSSKIINKDEIIYDSMYYSIIS